MKTWNSTPESTELPANLNILVFPPVPMPAIELLLAHCQIHYPVNNLSKSSN